MLPSQQTLRELLSYDPLTGLLTWNVREGQNNYNAIYAGKPALNCLTEKGYLKGTLLGKTVRAHKVIWKWLYGSEPAQIDHDNGIRNDNRKVNLNAATTKTNPLNQKMPVTNTSGHIGVRCRKGRWIAFINHKRRQIPLGCFDSLEEAKAARRQGEIDYGYHPNHGRKV